MNLPVMTRPAGYRSLAMELLTYSLAMIGRTRTKGCEKRLPLSVESIFEGTCAFCLGLFNEFNNNMRSKSIGQEMCDGLGGVYEGFKSLWTVE